MDINIEFVSQWNIEATFVLDFESSWNIGEQRLFWYRVQGECQPQPCSDNPCKMIFVTNVLAPNLESVCRQLTERQLNWKIESIQKSSRPAERSVQRADEAIGIDHSCDVPVEVPFCNVPACLNYCP